MEIVSPLAEPLSSVRYAECPHCHHEVMEQRDGQCLACGKSHFDRLGVDPDKTMVTIDNVHRLPSCCFLCGQDTQRMQKLSWTQRAGTWNLPWWFGPLVALFSYLPGSQYRTRERICLPVCGRCVSTARKIQPLSIRTGLDCRLLVHREFRRQFETLNDKSRLEWEAEIRINPHAKSAATLLSGGIKI